MENERDNNLAKPKKENLGLKITLGVLGVCILGLISVILLTSVYKGNTGSGDVGDIENDGSVLPLVPMEIVTHGEGDNNYSYDDMNIDLPDDGRIYDF